MLPTEKVRIVPILSDFTTAGASSLDAKARYIGQGDVDVIINVRAAATLATGITATVAHNWDFSVIESTAATAAGSVVSNAVLQLGAATAHTARGLVNCVLKVATNAATSVGITLNGVRYIGTAAGATGGNYGVKLASAINGNATSPKLSHYSAFPNYGDKDQVLITADDDMATGLEVVSTSGGIAPMMCQLQGIIHVPAGLLSTNSPKYIGLAATYLTGETTSIKTAYMVSYPSNRGITPGRLTITT